MFNLNVKKCQDLQVSKFKTMGQSLDRLGNAHAMYQTYLGNI